MGYRYWTTEEKAPLEEMIREHGVEEIVNQLCQIATAMGRDGENPFGQVLDLEKLLRDSTRECEEADQAIEEYKNDLADAKEKIIKLTDLVAPELLKRVSL